MPDDRLGQNQPVRSFSDSGTVTFRPRVAHDDDDIVVIYNRQEADSAPLTPARYRLEQAEQTPPGDARYSTAWAYRRRPIGSPLMKGARLAWPFSSG